MEISYDIVMLVVLPLCNEAMFAFIHEYCFRILEGCRSVKMLAQYNDKYLNALLLNLKNIRMISMIFSQTITIPFIMGESLCIVGRRQYLDILKNNALFTQKFLDKLIK